MSTKIYGGFRFKPRTTWAAAHAEIMRFRRIISRDAYAARCRDMAIRCALAVDRAFAEGGRAPDGVFADVLAEMTKEARETHETFDLALFPHGRRIYGIAFGEDSLCERWADRMSVERWPYWNNTDRPDGVSAREWNHRRKTWDAILGGNGQLAPAECGFIAQCLPNPPEIPRPDDVLAKIPAKEARAGLLAWDLLAEARMRAKAGDDEADAWRGYFEARAWLKSPEGMAAREAESARLMPLLPDRIEAVMIGIGGK